MFGRRICLVGEMEIAVRGDNAIDIFIFVCSVSIIRFYYTSYHFYNHLIVLRSGKTRLSSSKADVNTSEKFGFAIRLN